MNKTNNREKGMTSPNKVLPLPKVDRTSKNIRVSLIMSDRV